jgi:hypothetical protein
MVMLPESRRSLLFAIGAAATVGQLPRLAAAQGTIRKRKNIETLTPAELQAYEHAIQIVKARSTANPNDPSGYQFWASLHDNSDDSIHSGCTHFSEKFFPWHRRYLADFEVLLQQTDPPVTANVTIPYWDWTLPPKTGRHFPAAFEQPSSPLFDNRLAIAPPPWDPADIHDQIQEPDWNLFAGKPDPSSSFGSNPGSVESGPHNTLHTNISRHMRSPETAVMDPIFWSFHSGIDLVWSRWQHLHVTAAKPQPFSDPTAIIWFRDRSFTVATTARTTDFNYEYDYDFSGDGPPPTAGLLAARAVRPGITSPASRVVRLGTAVGQNNNVAAQSASAGSLAPSAVLRLADVRVFHDRSYRLLIYLHPKDVNLATLAPTARARYLMRTITLWRPHHDGAVEVFVRPTPAQLAGMNQGSIITVLSEAVPNDGEPPPAGAHTVMPMVATARLPATSQLFQTLEFQER